LPFLYSKVQLPSGLSALTYFKFPQVAPRAIQKFEPPEIVTLIGTVVSKYVYPQ